MSGKPPRVNVAEAKKSLSELLGRVAYGKETITIVKRGRPMARLVPVSPAASRPLSDVKGWLQDADPFFEHMRRIIEERHSRRPRRVHALKG